MNYTNNMKDDIEKYSKMWDSMIADKENFPVAEKLKDPTHDVSFFGQRTDEESDVDKYLNESNFAYWAKVAGLEESNEDIPKITPGSLGKDQEVVVTQNWGVGGKKIEELTVLKTKLEKLENKLAKMDTEKNTSMESEIESLKKKIDDLSDSLNKD